MNRDRISKPDVNAPLAELVRGVVREELDRFACDFSPQERPPALLDRAGLARELNVSLSKVDRLRREGMPELMLGDSPRFEPEAVISWLRDRRPKKSDP